MLTFRSRDATNPRIATKRQSIYIKVTHPLSTKTKSIKDTHMPTENASGRLLNSAATLAIQPRKQSRSRKGEETVHYP